MSLNDAVCGGVHCFDTTAYCCTDNVGAQYCCTKSLYEEVWFWPVLLIGFLLLFAVVFCSCRRIYRYHNAFQYTRLRKQSQTYGTVSNVGVNASMPPPPLLGDLNQSESCAQLPSYSAVMGLPPAYSETEDETR